MSYPTDTVNRMLSPVITWVIGVPMPRTKPIGIRLDDELRAAVTIAAAKDGRSISAFVKKLTMEWHVRSQRAKRKGDGHDEKVSASQRE